MSKPDSCASHDSAVRPDRRAFLAALALPAAAAVHPGWLRAPGAAALRELAETPGTPQQIAQDEDYWAEVARAYTVDRSALNFNNGGVSPATRFAQESEREHVAHAHRMPSHHLWREQQPKVETVRARLAKAWDVSAEEIALTRNASEGLQILQFGLDLEAGDAVLTTTQDYPRMLNTFRQRERREKIRLLQVPPPQPEEAVEVLVARFEEVLRQDDRVRVILVSHVINLTGHVMPVRAIADMARGYGVRVMVDGAHSFAHLDFKLRDLGVDFYATSLHKWLSAPHGTGLLYVRQECIADVWPLMAAADTQREDIRKFEEIGTHPLGPKLGIAEALTFHLAIGHARKLERFLYLRDRWARRLTRHDRVHLNTSLAPGRASGVANMAIDGLEPGEIYNHLWTKHRILTTTIGHLECRGVRVSPHVYTTLPEIDRFCEVIEDLLRTS